MKKIEISFEFNGLPYQSVIRVRKQQDSTEYQIAIMDRKLERVLYGNQFIKEINGQLHAGVTFENQEQTTLKLIIASVLSHYLKIPCFVGQQCLVSKEHLKEGWEELHPIARHKLVGEPTISG